jgi:hypothetical protein
VLQEALCASAKLLGSMANDRKSSLQTGKVRIQLSKPTLLYSVSRGQLRETPKTDSCSDCAFDSFIGAELQFKTQFTNVWHEPSVRSLPSSRAWLAHDPVGRSELTCRHAASGERMSWRRNDDHAIGTPLSHGKLRMR